MRALRGLVLGRLAARIGRLPWHRQRQLHNIVAHPLLELWPAAGEWLHDAASPE